PANVRVLMAARPNTWLGGLRSARRGLAEVTIDPTTPDVRKDLDAYARRNLLTTEVDAAVRADGVDVEDFLHRVVNRSPRNFLYLSAYTRALTDVTSAGLDRELAAALISFRDIPDGLRGLYTFSSIRSGATSPSSARSSWVTGYGPPRGRPSARQFSAS